MSDLMLAEESTDDLRVLISLFPEPDDGGAPIECGEDEVDLKKLATKEINNLPDSAFAIILPGGKKDKTGRTTPRSLRKFPIHDAAHVRNALARLPQSNLTPKQKAQARKKIVAAAKKFKIKVTEEKNQNDPGRSLMSTPANETKTVLAPADGQEDESIKDVNLNVESPAQVASEPQPEVESVKESGLEANAKEESANDAPLQDDLVAFSRELNVVKNELKLAREALAVEQKARQEAELAKVLKDIESVATKEQLKILNDFGLDLTTTFSKDATVLELAASLVIAGAGQAEKIIPTEEVATKHSVEDIASEVQAKLSGYEAGLRRRHIGGDELKKLVSEKRAELIGPDA